MVQHRVVICCWQHGHETELIMTKRQEEKLSQQLENMKAVCPVCRDAGNGNQPIFIKEGETLFNQPKVFRCRHGHITIISAFANNRLHVRYGHQRESFVNIQGTVEELSELIDNKEISCHHSKERGRGRTAPSEDTICDCKLKAVDNYILHVPEAAGIKTRTRVGDLWDRHGIEPVRQGTYDDNGDYHQTRSEVANRERLKRMRERNIPEENMPGRRIDKPTKKTYKRRKKSDLDMN